MHTIKIYLLVALLMMAGTVMAQSRLYVEPRLGYGTFGMTSMKEFQQNFIKDTQVNGKATDTFGSYYQYGFNVVMDLNDQARVGLLLERGSTGGRVAYKDYSGGYTLDTPVKYTALGLLLHSYKPIGKSRLSYLMGIEAHLILSRLLVNGHSRIYSYNETFEAKFNSTGVGFKPYVGLEYPVMKLPARIIVGYLGSASRAFHVPGEPDHYLVRNNKNYMLEPGWSGLRINFSVSIPIFNLPAED